MGEIHDTIDNRNISINNVGITDYVVSFTFKDGFHNMTCYLPTYEIKEINGYSDKQVEEFVEIIKSTAHLIMEFAKEGGFEHASGF